MAKKFGMNEYAVFVVASPWDEPKLKCLWLGHHRFRCEKCKKGYFNVKTDLDHPDFCSSCNAQIVVRFEG